MALNHINYQLKKRNFWSNTGPGELYYFSDENIKNSYRSYKNIDQKIKDYSKNLPLLKNDTENVIEYVKQTDKKKKKKFNFWKLLEND